MAPVCFFLRVGNKQHPENIAKPAQVKKKKKKKKKKKRLLSFFFFSVCVRRPPRVPATSLGLLGFGWLPARRGKNTLSGGREENWKGRGEKNAVFLGSAKEKREGRASE